MFKYCPACASEKIRFEQGKVFRCPDCGFTYYHNNAAATACIVNTKTGLLFLVREKEPGKGLLDLPGGFIDPGESAVEGLRRELTEELGKDLTLLSNTKEPVFFTSFPNVYTYKNISYNTCDLFFYLDAVDVTEKDLHLETAEISAVRFIKKEDLDFNGLAFESVKKAVRLWIDMEKVC
jgi:ADP-ribose pyrophosphatase YjhB (NUDIX family)